MNKVVVSAENHIHFGRRHVAFKIVHAGQAGLGPALRGDRLFHHFNEVLHFGIQCARARVKQSVDHHLLLVFKYINGFIEIAVFKQDPRTPGRVKQFGRISTGGAQYFHLVGLGQHQNYQVEPRRYQFGVGLRDHVP